MVETKAKPRKNTLNNKQTKNERKRKDKWNNMFKMHKNTMRKI